MSGKKILEVLDNINFKPIGFLIFYAKIWASKNFTSFTD